MKRRALDLDVWPLAPRPALEAVHSLRALGPLVWWDAARPSCEPTYSALALRAEEVLRWRAGMDWSPFDRLASAQDGELTEPAPWPLVGGLCGWMGYEARHALERLPGRPPAAHSLPDAWCARPAATIVFDHRAGTVHLAIARERGDPVAAQRATELSAQVRTMWALPGRAIEPFAGVPVQAPHRAAHEARVAAAQEAIRAGEVYQVNLGQQWTAPRQGDPLSLYAAMRLSNPPAHGVFIDLGAEGAVLSCSPERFLRVEGRTVITRPIKGTAPRGKGAAEDAAAAAGLLQSQKDGAELAMIVDVLRNDLARSAVLGSVQVATAKELETHPTVHHLVAEVRSRLAEGQSPIDALKAAFPGGSITGAPRVRAMEVIDELEDFRRGLWCGSALWWSADGRFDSNILIRTVIAEGERYLLAGGGGITIRSDPKAEDRECEHKVRALIAALEGRA